MKNFISIFFLSLLALSEILSGYEESIETAVKMFGKLPRNFYKYSWYVTKASREYWPELLLCKSYLVYIYAQVEQETCITLKHRHCWSPYAELKTKRDYGFGLGQITITKKYDNFRWFKRVFKEQLKGWKWEDRFNPYYQSIALVLYDKFLFKKVYQMSDNDYDRFCFMLSAYNGGLGWVIKDRLLCKKIRGCDPTKWFGHVEKHSVRKKYKIYKRLTSYDINRRYVKNIMKVRYKKYLKITDYIIGCSVYKGSFSSGEYLCR